MVNTSCRESTTGNTSSTILSAPTIARHCEHEAQRPRDLQDGKCGQEVVGRRPGSAEIAISTLHIVSLKCP